MATTISSMPLTRRSYYIVAVSSLEQIIGAALSTVVGVMLPMLQLTLHPEMPAFEQGFIGAVSLIGIAIGSPIIGKLSDKQGYLLWFRLCPVFIIAGAAICWLIPTRGCLIAGLLLSGIGVGGGYSLDSAYISELLPDKWRQVMVGIAKASCVIGFFGAALVCWLIVRKAVSPRIWDNLILIIGVLGVLTLLLRLRWAESPNWLMAHGRTADAQKAIDVFFGKNSGIQPEPAPQQTDTKPVSWASMFHGENLKRVIFSGIPWACEGLGVYGFGVFLPSLVMALGMGDASATGLHSVINSVEITTIVNFFILPGFILGLLLMKKVNHVKMLSWGFIGSALGLALLLIGYSLHLPDIVLITGFVIYEVTLNAGPHLITYIIPSYIYPVNDRGTGSGIAAMLGKVGAIVGVIVMPILIHAGGASLVLIVSIAVMLAGALISIIYGRLLNLTGSGKLKVKS